MINEMNIIYEAVKSMCMEFVQLEEQIKKLNKEIQRLQKEHSCCIYTEEEAQ